MRSKNALQFIPEAMILATLALAGCNTAGNNPQAGLTRRFAVNGSIELTSSESAVCTAANNVMYINGQPVPTKPGYQTVVTDVNSTDSSVSSTGRLDCDVYDTNDVPAQGNAVSAIDQLAHDESGKPVYQVTTK